MFSALYCVPNSDDAFNRSNKRNWDNTDKNGFNCAGYALGTFSWYHPYDEDNRPDWNIHRITPERVAKVLDKMIKDFSPYLRLIDTMDDVHEDEYIIAFRHGGDDFHYMKYEGNGKWTAKMGWAFSIDTFTTEQVFSDSWEGKYNSKVYLFAMKINRWQPE